MVYITWYVRENTFSEGNRISSQAFIIFEAADYREGYASFWYTFPNGKESI